MSDLIRKVIDEAKSMENIVINILANGQTYTGRVERIIDDHVVLRATDRIFLVNIDVIGGLMFKSDVMAKKFQSTKIIM